MMLPCPESACALSGHISVVFTLGSESLGHKAHTCLVSVDVQVLFALCVHERAFPPADCFPKDLKQLELSQERSSELESQSRSSGLVAKT